jgi:F-type H+-transporting ATPase subunit a
METVININIGGFDLSITKTVITMWIIMAMLIVLALILTFRLETIPRTGRQKFGELLVGTINDFAKSFVGHYWRPFAPYIGTLIIFLVLSNIISIFNFIPGFKLIPPTRNINVPGALAVMTIVMLTFAGIRYKGFKGWLKSFVEPHPMAIFTKLLDYFTRPLSLTLRLFGNIFGAYMIMEMIYSAMPAFAPAALSIYFDLFDGILQAFVFTFLTTLYLQEVLE